MIKRTELSCINCINFLCMLILEAFLVIWNTGILSYADVQEFSWTRRGNVEHAKYFYHLMFYVLRTHAILNFRSYYCKWYSQIRGSLPIRITPCLNIIACNYWCRFLTHIFNEKRINYHISCTNHTSAFTICHLLRINDNLHSQHIINFVAFILSLYYLNPTFFSFYFNAECVWYFLRSFKHIRRNTTVENELTVWYINGTLFLL